MLAGRKEGRGKKSAKCGTGTPGWFLPIKQSPGVKTATVGVTVHHFLECQCTSAVREQVFEITGQCPH